MAGKPLISVVTVVFNNSKSIITTMESVLTQTYENIEYILIDGDSSDGTREIVYEYILSHSTNLIHKENTDECLHIESTSLANSNFKFKFLSQKDNGIYDAMNKGIDLATGKWCNFMNCGDVFYSSDVLESVFSNDLYDDIAVIYGDTQVVFDSLNSKILYSSHNHKYHHKFVHQSSFINTKHLKQYRYDTSFKIAGDTDLFTRIYNDNHKFKYVENIVSCFSIDGVSSFLSWKMFKEDCKIGFKYNKLFPILHCYKYLFWIIPRVITRNLIPQKFQNKARILFGKKRM